jgi:hypothetical protein
MRRRLNDITKSGLALRTLDKSITPAVTEAVARIAISNIHKGTGPFQFIGTNFLLFQYGRFLP